VDLKKDLKLEKKQKEKRKRDKSLDQCAKVESTAADAAYL